VKADVVAAQAGLVDLLVNAVFFGDHFAEAGGVDGVEAEWEADSVVKRPKAFRRLHQVETLV
jgi:hypothetical protein